MFDRRAFVIGSMAAMACPTEALSAPPAQGWLTVHPDRVLNTIPLDYTGFSVEKAQLSDPDYYHPGNKSLIGLFRRLSPRGVLRIGGNSSEFCWWKVGETTPAPAVRAAGWGRKDNTMPQRMFAVTPEGVRALRGFLDETGWSCIWGLNLGTATPTANAAEAAFVAKTLGGKLKYFQFGNEPDFYGKPNTLLRPPSWDFATYFAEWTTQARTVLTTVPEARFGGPDVGANLDWIIRFSEDAPKHLREHVVGLSGHYYAAGPPDAPYVTISNLLKAAPNVAARMDRTAAAAKAAGLSFRMTETNSCYRGGKPGMSDTFAAALWGGDYMLDLAAHGCQGINFHGGSGAIIAHSLGDMLPGAKTETDRKTAKAGAFYAPIAGDRESGFFARPLYFGMLMGQRFAGTAMHAVDFDAGGVNATAYAASDRTGFRIAIFNKDEARDLSVELAVNGSAGIPVQIWRLTAPALAATEAVTFTQESLPGGRTGRPKIVVPRASAALIFA